MATKKTVKKSNTKELTNGALALIILFCALIGFLFGYLIGSLY